VNFAPHFLFSVPISYHFPRLFSTFEKHFNMPSFSSPSPPISTRLPDVDPRPLPGTQPPLPTLPPTHKASPVLIPPKTPPAARADSLPPPAAKERVGNNPPNAAIDRNVFDQVLELDEDDELFSKDMVDAYSVQADKTFKDMDVALAQKNLPELSSLGHFLKGSSAALGVSKVQQSCEHIQHYGQLQEGTASLTESEAIVKITKCLARAREEYKEAKVWLDWFYARYKCED